MNFRLNTSTSFITLQQQPRTTPCIFAGICNCLAAWTTQPYCTYNHVIGRHTFQRHDRLMTNWQSSYRHIRLEISGGPSERISDSPVHRNRKHHFVRFRQAQTIFWRNYKTRSNSKHEAQTTNSDHNFHLLKKSLEPRKASLENTNEGSQYKSGERCSQAGLKFSPASQQSRAVLIQEKSVFLYEIENRGTLQSTHPNEGIAASTYITDVFKDCHA